MIQEATDSKAGLPTLQRAWESPGYLAKCRCWLNSRLSTPRPHFQALPCAAGAGLCTHICALPAGSTLGFSRRGARGTLQSWRRENGPSGCCPVGIPSAVLLPSRSRSFLWRQLPGFGFSNTLTMNFIMPLRDPSTDQATPLSGTSTSFLSFPGPKGGSCFLPLLSP